MRGAVVALVAIAMLCPDAGDAAPSGCGDATVGGRLLAVSGRWFPALAGLREQELRAWSFSGTRRVTVPFQIDECDRAGRVVVDASGSGPSPLGERSVVLFRSESAGDRAAAVAVSANAFEVEIAAPGHEPRWIYFGPDDGSLPPAPDDDVDYDPARDRIFARRYTLGFDDPQVGYFSLADGKGRDRANLIDRLKARVEARILWGLISFRRNEDQVRETVLGYRDGPIRVVRRAKIEIDIGWGIPSPSIVADDSFYAEHAEAPVAVSIPFSLGYVFGDLDVRLYLDFRDLEGFRLAAEGLAGHLRVGSPAQALPEDARTTWFLLARDDVGMLHRIRFTDGLEGVRSRLYYVDDPDLDDAPESVPGLSPGVGYRLTGWDSVARGRHEVWMDTWVLDGAMDPDPAGILAALDRSFTVRVRQLPAALLPTAERPRLCEPGCS